MNVLQRGVAVRSVRDLQNEEIRRFEGEWNGVFTKLGVLQGQLKSRRTALASQSPISYHMDRLLRRPALSY